MHSEFSCKICSIAGLKRPASLLSSYSTPTAPTGAIEDLMTSIGSPKESEPSPFSYGYDYLRSAFIAKESLAVPKPASGLCRSGCLFEGRSVGCHFLCLLSFIARFLFFSESEFFMPAKPNLKFQNLFFPFIPSRRDFAFKGPHMSLLND